MSEITIEDFIKLDLRIARIETAESVEEADKLLKLELDLGPLGKKTVFAGMKQVYEPESLINKMVVCVNNLKERKMRFGTSEGMILFFTTRWCKHNSVFKIFDWPEWWGLALQTKIFKVG